MELALPGGRTAQGIMHFVYPSRRPLPGVRALVDFLAERLAVTTREKHEECMRRASPP